MKSLSKTFKSYWRRKLSDLSLQGSNIEIASAISIDVEQNDVIQIKQIIVVRKDLKNKNGEKVRSGKLMAQASHASLESYKISTPAHRYIWETYNQYKKIVLSVHSEAELLALHNTLEDAGLHSSLILDSGLTEFNSPTYTCLAVLDLEDRLNRFTSSLSLF